MRGIFEALGFLTVLPVPRPAGSGEPGRGAAWFPVVGLALGGLLWGAHHLLGLLFPPLLAAALLVAVWAAATGGLHLEGLADSLDGLLASATPGRRLEIMRDPRLGAFGAGGLALFLILKTAAVEGLGGSGVLALLLAPALARWAVLLAAKQPRARPEGMAVAMARGLGPRAVLLGALLPLGPTAWDLWRGGSRALVSLGAALAITAAVALVSRRRLGGITGDVLGLVIEAVELATLAAFSARGAWTRT